MQVLHKAEWARDMMVPSGSVFQHCFFYRFVIGPQLLFAFLLFLISLRFWQNGALLASLPPLPHLGDVMCLSLLVAIKSRFSWKLKQFTMATFVIPYAIRKILYRIFMLNISIIMELTVSTGGGLDFL